MKRKPIKILEDKAWAIFSKFIRLRDCKLTTGTLKRGKCFTCNTILSLDRPHTAHAGHFLTRGAHHSVKFDERNTHLQCFSCNNMKSGNLIEYMLNLEKLYGRKEINDLILKSNQPKKFTELDYENIIKTYTKKIEELENNG